MVRAHRITADGIEVTMSDGRVLTLTKSRAKADITAASNNLSSARTTSRNRLADAMALTRTFLTVEYDAQGNLTQLEIRYV